MLYVNVQVLYVNVEVPYVSVEMQYVKVQALHVNVQRLHVNVQILQSCKIWSFSYIEAGRKYVLYCSWCYSRLHMSLIFVR